MNVIHATPTFLNILKEYEIEIFMQVNTSTMKLSLNQKYHLKFYIHFLVRKINITLHFQVLIRIMEIKFTY